eukprot:TRINITY_DN13760_c0_g1_i1.p1 TRINITY_DN13760_c0_g1~~TRINITY_DN13760_c0_g1_i1.p1  ORF type:complete len:226 (-),score=53.51 TRINITY_DN13760_c0_g1_i1:28-654(-)
MSVFDDPNNGNATTVYVKATLKNHGNYDLSKIRIMVHGYVHSCFNAEKVSDDNNNNNSNIYAAAVKISGENLTLTLPKYVGGAAILKPNTPHEFYYMTTKSPDLNPLRISILDFTVDNPITNTETNQTTAQVTPTQTVATSKNIDNWSDFFKEIGFEQEFASKYLSLFEQEDIQFSSLSELTSDILKELDIKLGHRMLILKLKKDLGY